MHTLESVQTLEHLYKIDGCSNEIAQEGKVHRTIESTRIVTKKKTNLVIGVCTSFSVEAQIHFHIIFLPIESARSTKPDAKESGRF